MEKVIFTKYSNERSPQFAIATEIIVDDSHRKSVIKRPMSDLARPHVERIEEWYEKLGSQFAESDIRINVCKRREAGLQFEYLEGETLENRIDACLMKQDVDGALAMMENFFEKLKSVCVQESFQVTPEFKQVFGDVQSEDAWKYMPVTDLDLIFNNVICQDKLQIIDYEWTFDFPIPVNYVIYRALHYLQNSSTTRPAISGMNLYEKFAISREEITQFESMERHFQKYIEGSLTPIRSMYEDISLGCVDVMEQMRRRPRQRELSMGRIFWKTDVADAYCEEHSMMVRPNQHGELLVEYKIPADVCALRIDPGEHSGVLYIYDLCLDNQAVTEYRTNGISTEEGAFLFLHGDPQIIFEIEKGKSKILKFSMKMNPMDPASSEILGDKMDQLIRSQQESKDKMNQLKQKNRELVHKIKEMESTKAWSFYRKYRDLVEKRK